MTTTLNAPDLVSGGNIHQRPTPLRGRASLNRGEEIITWTLLLSAASLIIFALLRPTVLGAFTKVHVHTSATTTTFHTAYTVTGGNTDWATSRWLLLVAALLVAAALTIRQLALREEMLPLLRTAAFVYMGTIAVSFLVLAVANFFLIALLPNPGPTDASDGQMRAAADSWVAQNLNLNQTGYEIKYASGETYDPVFLRDLNPDGSLKQVYKVVTTQDSITIKPQ